MQPGRGHYSHPRNLRYNQSNGDLFHPNSRSNGQQFIDDIGARAAQALTSALANPYAQTHPGSNSSYTNSNYHAYFMQQRPMTTAEGYSISSTYMPTTAPSPVVRPRVPRGRGGFSTLNTTSRPLPSLPFNAHGDSKCRYEGCSFGGSKKSVDTHMMDRHLIYPPGWKKKKDNWDADPSLKGKPVPVPGTGLLLDTPEAVETWLAERKKRYPSKQNVEEKKRKAQEAADRGEIDPSELTAKARKRSRVERDDGATGSGGNSGRMHRKGGRGSRSSGWRGRGFGGPTAPKPKQQTTAYSHLGPNKEINVRDNASSGDSGSDSEGSSESNSDMDPAKDAISSKTYQHNPPGLMDNTNTDVSSGKATAVAADPPIPPDAVSSATPSFALQSVPRHKPSSRPPPYQPRPAFYNLFASRPSLLRHLLLPEIRHTVSHLSQAIHFLVENDFLEGVELKPGDADEQRIKIVD